MNSYIMLMLFGLQTYTLVVQLSVYSQSVILRFGLREKSHLGAELHKLDLSVAFQDKLHPLFFLPSFYQHPKMVNLYE